MSEFLPSLVSDILGGLDSGRRLVAVDGVDGSGKSMFATSLASCIALHRPAALIHMDDFLNPAALRYRRGRTSAEGFWLDSYDYDTFMDVVVRPLSPGGDGRYVPAAFDVTSDAGVCVASMLAPADAVIVVEGLFLHRSELGGLWDASVFLDVPFDVTAARMADRDGSHPDPGHPSLQRYMGGQLLYFAAARPWERATYVVDNSDVHLPRLIKPSDACASRTTEV